MSMAKIRNTFSRKTVAIALAAGVSLGAVTVPQIVGTEGVTAVAKAETISPGSYFPEVTEPVFDKTPLADLNMRHGGTYVLPVAVGEKTCDEVSLRSKAYSAGQSRFLSLLTVWSASGLPLRRAVLPALRSTSFLRTVMFRSGLKSNSRDLSLNQTSSSSLMVENRLS